MDLKQARVAVLVEQQYQEMEVWYPLYRLREAGCLEQVTNISEPLPPLARAAIYRAFGVRVADDYAMAECMALTSGCGSSLRGRPRAAAGRDPEPGGSS